MMKQEYLETIEKSESIDLNRTQPYMSHESFLNAIESIPGLYGIAQRALGIDKSEIDAGMSAKKISVDAWESIKLQISIEFSKLSKTSI